MMDRRAFITGLGAVLVAPLATAAAQSTRSASTVGVLGTTATTTPWSVRIFEAFKQSLRENGWVEGKSVRFEPRWSEGRPERFPELAAELVRLKVDVIVASSSQATKAAMEATRTIPIVFVGAGDPVGAGFVQSLARPGGNVTGVTNQLSDLADKDLQLAREVVPRLRHVAIMWNPDDQGSARGYKNAQDRYSSLGVKITSAPVRSPEDFEAAFEILSRERPDFLMVHPSPVIYSHRQRVAEFAVRKRLPTITGFRGMVEDGSVLISYGPDPADLFRQAGLYVSKVLRGARPADLPVEQPTKFELIINLKTAKTLGLAIPQSLLLRADQVID
jgi:putative ABC transport system substrate-binding protein